MTILDELAGATNNPCKLCSYLDGREDAGDWRRALAEPVSVVGHTAVVAALKRRGVDISERSVRRHRAGHTGG